MLVKWMISLGALLFDVIFSLLGVLPQMPEPAIQALDFVFDIMFGSVNLAAVFIDFGVVRMLIPITIAIFNFDHIIKFVTYVLKKIPILGIK